MGDMRVTSSGARRWLTAVVMAAVSAAAVAGCTSTSNSKSSPPVPPPPVSSRPTSLPASPSTSLSGSPPVSTPAPPVSSSAGVITVTDKPSLRKTVSLHVGNRLRVVLGSTYWRFGELAANPAVQSVGSTAVTPDPDCIPGGGCGTAVHEYSVVGSGRATITATRTSCGEALACRPDQRTFTLVVTVTA